MKRTSSFIAMVVLALLALIVSASISLAQGSGTQSLQAPQAPVGSAFTYQGLLKNSSGQPVTAICDFQFTLWDSLSGATQLGDISSSLNVTVTQGYFTVLVNAAGEFGVSAFASQARWLAISVRCPAGSGDYTVLTPRQALTPAPYALALPGFYTRLTANNVNIVGGASNNVVSGAIGATLSGGGTVTESNRVTRNFGTISGGYRNTVEGIVSVASGGYSNTVSGEYSVVSGGRNNTVGGDWAVASGGEANTASGDWAVVSGGKDNTAASSLSTVGGGHLNTASNPYAIVSGGWTNTADGYGSVVGGGMYNTASGRGASVPGGTYAVADHYGQLAYASGGFSNTPGNAQASLYVLRNTSTGTAWTDLYLNGTGERLTLAISRTVTFDILIVASDDGTGQSAGYQIQGVIKNVGGAMNFVGTPVYTTLGEDDTLWNVQVLADDAYDALRIQVRGNNETIRWVATVQTAEVAW
jgi:trimeric autotransporter adhesin